MGTFNPVVLPLRSVMPSRETEFTNRRSVGPQLFRDQRAKCKAPLLKQLPHQFRCRAPVPSGLDQDVEHLAVLVDGTSQIHAPTADRDEHLIEMPLRMCNGPVVAQIPRDLWSKPGNPPPDGLIGDLDSPLGRHIFLITEAQCEAVIEPNRVLDDIWREMAIAIADRRHLIRLPAMLSRSASDS